jgi:hypothetical protein
MDCPWRSRDIWHLTRSVPIKIAMCYPILQRMKREAKASGSPHRIINRIGAKLLG